MYIYVALFKQHTVFNITLDNFTSIILKVLMVLRTKQVYIIYTSRLSYFKFGFFTTRTYLIITLRSVLTHVNTG